MRKGRLLLAAGLSLLMTASASWSAGQRKKKDVEPVTQVLELPKDPPAVAFGDTQRLVFHVSALSSQGLLSRQMSDALKNLRNQWRGAVPIKLRAFVAGSGDVRRVQAIVSETFTDRRQPIPAVSVVQVGGLPLAGAQVVVESISVAKKAVNPQGLVFLSGHGASSDNPVAPLEPLAGKVLGQVKASLAAAGTGPEDVLQVTCYFSSLTEVNSLRHMAHLAFPKAARNYVQTQLAVLRSLVECEAVARLRSAPVKPLAFLNAAEGAVSEGFSRAALVNAPRLAFSGTQLAFRSTEEDVRLAFQRLQSTLDSAKSGYGNVALAHYYPLSDGMAARIRALQFEFLDKANPPAGTMVAIEGLPSLDSSFGVDVVAVVP